MMMEQDEQEDEKAKEMNEMTKQVSPTDNSLRSLECNEITA